MTRIAVDRAYTMNVEISGKGEPLVLLHGFTGSARSLGRFGQLLSERFKTIAVDLAGHGKTDNPVELEHYRMEQSVKDLAALLRELGHQRAHWLGYSMGGRTALHVAAGAPAVVSKLVLIGASAGLDCVEDRVARTTADNLLAERIEREGVAAFVDYWEAIPLFATQRSLPPETQVAIRRARLGNTAMGLANSLRGMGTGAQEPLQHRLPELTMPTLAMAGDLDAKFTEIGRQLAATMPDARFVAVPGAGHAAHLEQPDFCAENTIAFLSALSG